MVELCHFKGTHQKIGEIPLSNRYRKEGEILYFIQTGEPAAVWGELASTCAKEKEIVGAVIYGATRDIDVLLHLDFPVFALETLPNGESSGIK